LLKENSQHAQGAFQPASDASKITQTPQKEARIVDLMARQKSRFG
jgi:hypothetical protein